MASQIAHRVAVTPAVVTDAGADDGMGERMVRWIREMYCGLHGHDTLMQFEKERVFLRCTSCGHETPGWTLTEAAPKTVQRGDPRRQALARPRLAVGARRIA
jgi:hypothetical protein